MIVSYDFKWLRSFFLRNLHHSCSLTCATVCAFKRLFARTGIVVLIVSGCVGTGELQTANSDTPSKGQDAFIAFTKADYPQTQRRIEFANCSAGQIRDLFPENYISAPRPLLVGKSKLNSLFAEAGGSLECALIGRKTAPIGVSADYLVRPRANANDGQYLTTFHVTYAQRNSDISGDPIDIISTASLLGATRGALQFVGTDARRAAACQSNATLCPTQAWRNDRFDYVVDVQGSSLRAVNLSKSQLLNLSFN